MGLAHHVIALARLVQALQLLALPVLMENTLETTAIVILIAMIA
jgi:hypothetical protein